MRVDDDIVVVFVSHRCGGLFWNLVCKFKAVGARVPVARNHVDGASQWHVQPVLGRVGRRVVVKERADLSCTVQWHVHAGDDKVAVGRIFKARVVQHDLKRRKVQHRVSHLFERAKRAQLNGRFHEANVTLSTAPDDLATTRARLFARKRRPLHVGWGCELQHGRKRGHALLQKLFCARYLLHQNNIKIGHTRRKREPLLRQFCSLGRSRVVNFRALSIIFVCIPEPQFERVERTNTQPVLLDQHALLGISRRRRLGWRRRSHQLHKRAGTRLVGLLLVMSERHGVFLVIIEQRKCMRLLLLIGELHGVLLVGLQLVVEELLKLLLLVGLQLVIFVEELLKLRRGLCNLRLGQVFVFKLYNLFFVNLLGGGFAYFSLERHQSVDGCLLAVWLRLRGVMLVHQEPVQFQQVGVAQPLKLGLAHVAQVARGVRFDARHVYFFHTAIKSGMLART